jgi:uncharacterized coiled-coil DUF342 family protein
MKHDVNFGLLGLLLLAMAALLILVMVHYVKYEGLRVQLEDMRKNYTLAMVNVTQTRAALAAEQAQSDELKASLQTNLAELNLSGQQVSSMMEHFTTVKGQADTLSRNLNDTMAERNKYAKQADQYYSESLDWKSKYGKASDDLSAANSRITRIKGSIFDLQSAAGQFGNEVGSLGENTNEVYAYSNDIRSSNNMTVMKDKAGAIKDDADAMRTTVAALQSGANRITTLLNALAGS